MIKLATLLSEKIEKLPVDNTPRMHLGASEIGTECTRALWYSFRWVTYPNFTNRLHRVFGRGHKEEINFEQLLKDAGCLVFTSDVLTGKQFTISDFNGHFGGSLDGIICGIPEMPDEWLLLEFKTSSDKYFKLLHGYCSKTKKYDTSKGQGVKVAQPKHYYQMQIYMHYKGLKKALYCSVNKNDDKLHFEIIDYNPISVSLAQQKAKVAIFDKEPPKKISNNPLSFKCLHCNHKGVCQLNEKPAQNCRTCKNVLMLDDGKWKCNLTDELKDKQGILNGCNQYELDNTIT